MSEIVLSPMTAEEARQCVSDINNGMITIRLRLLDLYEREGWRALGYTSWRDCAKTEFKYSQTRVYELLYAAEIERDISEVSAKAEKQEPIPEKHLRPLASLESSERREVWQQVEATAPNGKVTAAHVKAIKKEYEATRAAFQITRTQERKALEPEKTPDRLIPPTIPADAAIVNADSRTIAKLGIKPVHLVITSPPYNVGIDYNEHNDNLSQDAYLDLIEEVFRACYDVMTDGARIAVNVPFGVGRNPWVPFAARIMDILDAAGFTLRGQIIWDKGNSGNRTSWGSFRLPSDPSLRDTTEAIIVAHKGSSKLFIPEHAKQVDEKGTHTPALADSNYFMELAQDHWVVAPESARRVGHPAPFPVALARRLIDLYAYPGAHILDPFAGSGSTGIAATEAQCSVTLVEVDPAYCRMIEERLSSD